MILFILIAILLFTQLDETADLFYKKNYHHDPVIYDIAHVYLPYVECETIMNMYLIAFIFLFIPVRKEFWK